MGLATGAIDKFSWKSVGLSAIAAGVTAGLTQALTPGWQAAADVANQGLNAATAASGGVGALSAVGQAASQTSKFATVLSSFGNGLVRGVAANALTQGVAMATGLQKKFDFLGVATAGLSGGVGAAAGTGLAAAGASPFAQELGSSMAASIAGAGLRSIATGTSFGAFGWLAKRAGHGARVNRA